MPQSLCLCFPSCHGGTQLALDLSSPTFPHGELQIGTPPLVLSPRLCILPPLRKPPIPRGTGSHLK